MTKYALIIGISYQGTSKYLRGTRNDVDCIINLLTKWGFEYSNITQLSDFKTKSPKDFGTVGSKNPGTIGPKDFGTKNSGTVSSKSSGTTGHNELPTALNINKIFNAFVSKLKPNDIAFIYYSGHGTKMVSKNMVGKIYREESCLVPLDHTKVGIINSETIRYYLNKAPKLCNIMCVFDCCNSGSVCNLKYHIFDTSYKQDITLKMKSYNYKEWNRRQTINIETNNSEETKANVVCLSGSWTDQVSYDLGNNGALTYIFLNVIEKYDLSKLKLKYLLQNTRGGMLNLRVRQTPQLTCGNSLSLDTVFSEYLGIS